MKSGISRGRGRTRGAQLDVLLASRLESEPPTSEGACIPRKVTQQDHSHVRRCDVDTDACTELTIVWRHGTASRLGPVSEVGGGWWRRNQIYTPPFSGLG